MRRLLLFSLLAALGTARAARGQEQVIDVRAVRPPAANSFESLWAAYRKAEEAGDAEGAGKVLGEIRRLRIERNVRSLEELGLALVSRGLERLAAGERDRAEEEFQRAVSLDPQLPDAYFGLALAQAKKGPLGFLPAARYVVSGTLARLPTARGSYYLLSLAIPTLLLGMLLTATAVSMSLLLRHGTLLLHDLEEDFASTRGRPFAVGLFTVLLLLPAMTFQGWAWLPLWWLALLYIYLAPVEKAVAALAVAVTVAAGPALSVLETRVLAYQNPLFRAAILAAEGGGDARAVVALEAARAQNPDDRDLVYLLAAHCKKMGRYDDAAALYREILKAEAGDAVALNNLANVEFAKGEYAAAIARYKQGAEAPGDPQTQATFFYNLSLAHLQRFERQPADEALGQAKRLAGGLISEFDARWKYERGENAVVDLGLTQGEIWAKFAGAREGIGRKNVAGRDAGGPDVQALLAGATNRFLAFVGVFALVVVTLSRWRGKKMFTKRCLKCGTPFCKRCHLGGAAEGLCTQCYHLFVVRDGVSGPARNRKLLEVQKEDERRERVFRALSLLSPGAGHVYAHKTVAGLAFAFVWYLVISLMLLGGRVFPVTESPAAVAKPWTLALAGVLLLLTYVMANRARPDFEVAMPVRRPGASRAGAATARRARAS